MVEAFSLFYVFQKYFETIKCFLGEPKQFHLLENEQTTEAKLSFTLPHTRSILAFSKFTQFIVELNRFSQLLAPKCDFPTNFFFKLSVKA